MYEIDKEKLECHQKIKLIELIEQQKYKNLPYIIGNHKNFKDLYEVLKQLDFPFYSVKKFILYDSNRVKINKYI